MPIKAKFTRVKKNCFFTFSEEILRLKTLLSKTRTFRSDTKQYKGLHEGCKLHIIELNN